MKVTLSAIALVASFANLGATDEGYRTTPPVDEPSEIFEWNALRASNNIEYSPCYGNLECARLEVPLDWSNLSNPNSIQLAVARLPAKVNASDKSFGGSILLNPGGPSGSGIDLLRFAGRDIQTIVDGEKHFEIVSFDPRGTKYTTPSVSCFASDSFRALLALRIASAGAISSSNIAFGMHWASAEALAQLCARSEEGVYPDGSNIRQYVSTSLVARDMLEIIDRLEDHRRAPDINGRVHGSPQSVLKPQQNKHTENPLLNYWGFSYGTMLGNTFASMFPHRIGRMVLDGVVDAEDYVATGWTTNLQDNNKTWDKFFDYCFEAGSKCGLYDSSFRGPENVRLLIEDLLEELKENPLPVFVAGNVVLFTHFDLVTNMHVISYSPIQLWPLFANAIAQLLEGNVETALSQFAILQKPSNPLLLPIGTRAKPYVNTSLNDETPYLHHVEAAMTILCGDGDDITPLGRSGFSKYVRELFEQSHYVSDVWADITINCYHWPKSLRPGKSNRFIGPFTSNFSDYDPRGSPLLLIGNTADPVTPLRNAYKMAAKHEGSVVLTQDTPGHCSGPFNPSSCTYGSIREFFNSGKLPITNRVCPGDLKPWDLSN